MRKMRKTRRREKQINCRVKERGMTLKKVRNEREIRQRVGRKRGGT